MSNVLAGIVLVLPILFLIPFGLSAYAEIPSPDKEWDFDILGVEIEQNPNNLKQMIISVDILYIGWEPKGTVYVYAIITDPEGEESNAFGPIKNMRMGNNHILDLKHYIEIEGDYTIDLRITSPTGKYITHSFDSDPIPFNVPPNGFERDLGALGDDLGDKIVYILENPYVELESEVVHATINLPKEHSFEKITILNSEYEKDFSIDTKNIYLTSESDGFKNFSVNLVEETSIIPLAGAQTIHDYVKFTAMDNEICDSFDCVLVDYVEPVITQEDYSYWMWVLVPVSVTGGLLFYFLKKHNKHNCKLETIQNSNQGAKTENNESNIESPKNWTEGRFREKDPFDS